MKLIEELLGGFEDEVISCYWWCDWLALIVELSEPSWLLVKLLCSCCY